MRVVDALDHYMERILELIDIEAVPVDLVALTPLPVVGDGMDLH